MKKLDRLFDLRDELELHGKLDDKGRELHKQYRKQRSTGKRNWKATQHRGGKREEEQLWRR